MYGLQMVQTDKFLVKKWKALVMGRFPPVLGRTGVLLGQHMNIYGKW
jgi:hypothetical protein